MRLIIALGLIMLLTISASAKLTTATVGPYSISFDLSGATEPKVTTNINTSNDSSSYYVSAKLNNETVAGINIIDYNNWQYASTSLDDEKVLMNALVEAGEIRNPVLINRMVDGSMAEAWSYSDPQLDSNVTIVQYWKDSKEIEGYNIPVGKTKVEVLSTLQKDSAENLMNSLKVSGSSASAVTSPSAVTLPAVATSSPSIDRGFITPRNYDRACMKNYEDVGYTPAMIAFLGYCVDQ